MGIARPETGPPQCEQPKQTLTELGLERDVKAGAVGVDREGLRLLPVSSPAPSQRCRHVRLGGT